MNLYICSGNLTKDPELRSLKDGKSVTTLRVAVKGGRDQTLYVNVTVWDKPAENCCTYLRRGSPVMVRGELKEARVYSSRSGESKAELEVTADRYNGVEFGRQTDGDSDRSSRPKFNNKTEHDYRSNKSDDNDDEWTPF